MILIVTAILKQINQLPLCASKRITWAMMASAGIQCTDWCSRNISQMLTCNHYHSDIGLFIPLTEHFKQTYGFYPKYPGAQMLDVDHITTIFFANKPVEKYTKVFHCLKRKPSIESIMKIHFVQLILELMNKVS